MFFGSTIEETRAMFFSSWNNYQHKKPLSPLEKEIAQVILDHPEYHKMMGQQNRIQELNYYPQMGENNPFLHMGLHLAVREQVATNRPQGISAVYEKMKKKFKSTLIVEHLMMDQLAECLWLSQKNNCPPDEQSYLKALLSL